MENDPKTMLKQLVSNLELASMRAYALIDPETGFHHASRLHFMARLLTVLSSEAAEVMKEAYPSEHLLTVKLHEPTVNLDWAMEHAQLLMDQQITNGLGVPREHYDSPTYTE